MPFSFNFVNFSPAAAHDAPAHSRRNCLTDADKFSYRFKNCVEEVDVTVLISPSVFTSSSTLFRKSSFYHCIQS